MLVYYLDLDKYAIIEGTLVLPSKKGKTKKYWKSFRYPDQANYRLFG
jgi:hypothetical protein